MITIYFDTSFYVNLCRADEQIAADTIFILNSLDVRHVLSDIILRELLSRGDSPDRDQLIVNRVRQFQIAPYLTREGLNWNVLLYSGQERADLADMLKMLDDRMTLANSFSISARRKPPTKYAKLIEEKGKDILREAGFPGEQENDITQTLDAARTLVEHISGEILGDMNIDWEPQRARRSYPNGY